MKQSPRSKFKSYLQAMLPTPAISISLLILPVLATGYFLFTEYTNKVISANGVVSFNLDNSFVARFFFGLPWSSWFSVAGDFVMWAILALVGIVIAWLISAARVAYSNHVVEESFKNFKVSKASWHGHFAVAVFIKIALSIIFIYCLANLLAQAIPELVLAIQDVLAQASTDTILEVIKANVIIFLLQYAMAACIKIIKHTEVN